MEHTMGAKRWMIGDCYFPSASVDHGDPNMRSHESICVLNAKGEDAHLTLELFFEDREPLQFSACVLARRCAHIRMDQLCGEQGETVPQDVPYAVLVTSDVEIAVQYSRMDTRQAELTLMTTMGYAL